MVKINSGFILVVAAVYSFCLIYFDAVSVVPQLARQFTSFSYPSAEGQIVQSEIASHIGSKMIVRYSLKIKYSYAVNGEQYESSRVRFTDPLFRSLSLVEVQKKVASYPVGSKIKVFYNPTDPAMASLSAGFDGDDLMFIISSMPFYMVVFLLWIIPVEMLMRMFIESEVPELKIFHKSHCIHVRLARIRPAVAFTVLVGTLPILFRTCVDNKHTSLLVGEMLLVTVFGIAALVYCWLLKKNRAGDYDLIIDDISHQVRLPSGFGRNSYLTINGSDVSGVTVEIVKVVSSYKGQTSVSYAPTLLLRDGNTCRIANWADRNKAEDFAGWLRKQLCIMEQ